MNAPAGKPQADPVASFRRRCASTACDWLAGGDLHDAADDLDVGRDAARRGRCCTTDPGRGVPPASPRRRWRAATVTTKVTITCESHVLDAEREGVT